MTERSPAIIVWIAAALVFWLVVALIVVAPVRAATANRFDYLVAAPSSGVQAQVSIGTATPGQYVFVSVGGSDFLDIIQLGVKATTHGPRYFAAWGRGTPNGAGSLYVERDMGPAPRGWVKVEVRLWSDHVWRLRINGVTRIWVRDTFRDWTRRSVKAASESTTSRLGGTRTSPVQVRAARVWRSGWRLPLRGSYGPGSWYQGGYAIPAGTHDDYGRDWLEVWR